MPRFHLLLAAWVLFLAVPPHLWASDEDPADCPAWAKVQTPEWLTPFLGKRGLPEPYASSPKLLGKSVAGIDRWQANHFVVYRDETKKYLYNDYTPTKVGY